MGIVYVKAQIGATNDSLHEVEFMVDTGALYTMLPPQLCKELGLHMPLRERVLTADSHSMVIETGIMHIKIDGREGATLVGKMNVPSPLLGAFALESLGFKVDPVNGVLEPTRPFPESPALLSGWTATTVRVYDRHV
jgi:clan AA aspartic protease